MFNFKWDGNIDPILYATKLKNKCLLATNMHDKEFNFDSYLIPGLTKNMNDIKRNACLNLLQDTTNIHDILEYIADVFAEKGKEYFFDSPPKQSTGYAHDFNRLIWYMPLIPLPIYQPFLSIQG